MPSTLIRHENGPFPKRSANRRKTMSFSAAGDCCLFKFLRRGVDGKHLMCFHNENGVFKFLWGSRRGLRRTDHETPISVCEEKRSKAGALNKPTTMSGEIKNTNRPDTYSF